jgi:REP element-mobilizing transposase RayT
MLVALTLAFSTMSSREAEVTSSPRGWHSRGYLPHFDAGEVPQSITFRLAESIPGSLLRQWREEAKLAGAGATAADRERLRIETYLNQGIGPTWLAEPRIGGLVEGALLHFDGSRYRLHAWVIMPNHVHVVITPKADAAIPRIVASWKSYTATGANALLLRSGPFWQEDYFDRFIRDERHFAAAIRYVEHNPVEAGLCIRPEAWAFSSARPRKVQR